MSRKLLALAVVLSLLTGCNKKEGQESGAATPSATATSSPSASSDLTIAVIPKGTTHEYWRSVEAGANAAGQELKVKIEYKGPLNESDRGQQISIVETFVSEGVSGIVLAPLDEQALVSPVREAADKKIPVVIIDSALKGEAGKDFVSFVATNNKKGGQLGGEALAKALGEGDKKIVLLRYAAGSASTDDRESGFLEEMGKHPGYKMLVDNQYAGATLADAQKASENLLSKLKEADGVFCPNESSTHGMLLTLEANGLAGKIKFVGFDATKPLLDALKSGEIETLIAQDPYKMGYLGVQTAVHAIRGEKVEPNIDTGVAVITKANLDDPAIKKMLGL